MTTLTTKETGGRAPLMTNVSFSPPDVAMTPAEMAAFLDGSGLNGPFIADLLSSFLTHEQCGLHLYRTAITLTVDPELRSKYEEFGAETEEHIRIFEDLSPTAAASRATSARRPASPRPSTARSTKRRSSCPTAPMTPLSSWRSSKPWSSPRRSATPTGCSSRSWPTFFPRESSAQRSCMPSSRSGSRRTSTSAGAARPGRP